MIFNFILILLLFILFNKYNIFVKIQKNIKIKNNVVIFIVKVFVFYISYMISKYLINKFYPIIEGHSCTEGEENCRSLRIIKCPWGSNTNPRPPGMSILTGECPASKLELNTPYQGIGASSYDYHRHDCTDNIYEILEGGKHNQLAKDQGCHIPEHDVYCYSRGDNYTGDCPLDSNGTPVNSPNATLRLDPSLRGKCVKQGNGLLKCIPKNQNADVQRNIRMTPDLNDRYYTYPSPPASEPPPEPSTPSTQEYSRCGEIGIAGGPLRCSSERTDGCPMRYGRRIGMVGNWCGHQNGNCSDYYQEYNYPGCDPKGENGPPCTLKCKDPVDGAKCITPNISGNIDPNDLCIPIDTQNEGH